jgi:tRNA threonylcarbamoyladenosine biosynthesis protein TsaB
MIRGVAIETSGRIGSIALAEDGHAVAEEQFPHGLKHAAEIVPIIARLCDGRGWKPTNIEEVYVSAGPGSFTGLRVGITVAKTLAFATGARVVAVGSVEVLARNAPPGWQNLILVLDAKRDQIFTASFENRGGTPALRAPAHLGSLAQVLARTPRPVHLLGDGIPYHGKFIPKDDRSIHLTPPELWQARAPVVAELGAAMARANRFADPMTLTPIYIRKPEAQEKFDARHGGGAPTSGK